MNIIDFESEQKKRKCPLCGDKLIFETKNIGRELNPDECSCKSTKIKVTEKIHLLLGHSSIELIDGEWKAV